MQEYVPRSLRRRYAWFLSPVLIAPAYRIRGSKHSLASLAGAHGTASLGLGLEAGTAGAGPGPSGSGSGAPSHATPETQLYTMYYREAMAAPRI